MKFELIELFRSERYLAVILPYSQTVIGVVKDAAVQPVIYRVCEV